MGNISLAGYIFTHIRIVKLELPAREISRRITGCLL